MRVQITKVTPLGDKKSLVELTISEKWPVEDSAELLILRAQVEHEQNPLLAEVHLAALHRARDVIGEANRAAANMRDHSRTEDR